MERAESFLRGRSGRPEEREAPLPPGSAVIVRSRMLLGRLPERDDQSKTMKRPRIYIDTSVIGGCFDEEFATWSNGLVVDFKAGLFRPILSDIVAAEVNDAPERVREKFKE